MMTRAQLQSRLRAFKARLVARQVLRCGFSGLAGAAAALGVGVVLIELLPRLLFGTSPGVWALVAAAVSGFAAGAMWELRRYRMPSLQEAAMALESRLPADTGALAAALRLEEQHPFLVPVLQRAEQDLRQAERAPAPVLIHTRRLVLVPLMALASGVAFAAVAGAETPDITPTRIERGEKQGGWENVDVGSARSSADARAYREALGLKDAAATLSNSAATLRDAASSEAQRESALSEAGKALDDAGEGQAGVSSAELPAAVPASEAERARLAERLEAAARALRSAATKIENGEAGTSDSGRDGDFDTPGEKRELVAFPAFAPRTGSPAGTIAAQTPARRELARRAVRELDRLQK